MPYVYRARRPFNQKRLVTLFRRWPLPNKALSITGFGEDDDAEIEPLPSDKDPTFVGVLRSKGTCWLDVDLRAAAAWSPPREVVACWAQLPLQQRRRVVGYTAGACDAQVPDARSL